MLGEDTEARITEARLDRALSHKYDQIVGYLQDAITATAKDEEEFQRVSTELQQSVNTLIREKADRACDDPFPSTPRCPSFRAPRSLRRSPPPPPAGTWLPSGRLFWWTATCATKFVRLPSTLPSPLLPMPSPFPACGDTGASRGAPSSVVRALVHTSWRTSVCSWTPRSIGRSLTAPCSTRSALPRRAGVGVGALGRGACG